MTAFKGGEWCLLLCEGSVSLGTGTSSFSGLYSPAPQERGVSLCRGWYRVDITRGHRDNTKWQGQNDKSSSVSVKKC